MTARRPSSDRQPQIVGQQVDLRRQTSTGAPQNPCPRPLFAARGRLLVSSHDGRTIIRYAFFRSATRSRKTFSQTRLPTTG